MSDAPPGSASARLAARLGQFRHRPFAIYWAGGLLSNLGTWLQAVAGSIFVYQLTGSPLAVGILNFAGFVPILLFSIAGGTISDRFDRRTVVVATHLVSGVLAAALAVITLAGAATDGHVILIAFLLNTSYAVAKPSIIAMLPGLVTRDEVTDAVALNTLQFILGQVLGPLIAALVMATAGAGWAFAVNALTFLGPIVAMAYLVRHGLGETDRADEAKAREGKAASARTYVREHRWILAVLAGVVAVSAPLEVIRTLSPVLVSEGLHEAESAAGMVVAAQAIGSAIGVALFAPLRRRGMSERTAAAGIIVQATGLVGTVLAGSLVQAALAVGLVGFGFSLAFPVLTGALQLEVPDWVRGRVMAFHQMSHLGNRPATALIVGALATLLGAQNAVLAGLVLTPIGLVASARAWASLRARPGTAPSRMTEQAKAEAEADIIAAAGR